jgi:hypothetical protein
MKNFNSKTAPVPECTEQSTQNQTPKANAKEDQQNDISWQAQLSFINWRKRRRRNSEPDPKTDKNRLVHRTMDNLLFAEKRNFRDSAYFVFIGEKVGPNRFEAPGFNSFESDDEAKRIFDNDLHLEEIQEAFINTIRELTEREDFVVRRRNSPFYAKPEVAYHYHELKLK